jgi:hypothetical protein
LPEPGGAASDAPAGSAGENSSISRPPGVPAAGSSVPPTRGKRKAPSLETRTSFCFVPTRLRMSLTAEMGRSVACAGGSVTAIRIRIMMPNVPARPPGVLMETP